MTIASILGSKGRDVFTITLPQTLLEVCSTLREHRIGAILIVDDKGKLAGILSERDIVRRIAEHGPDALQADTSECMTSNVVTCSLQDTIQTAMARMSEGRFRHIPVVENDELVGMVSIGDLVKRRIADAEREAEDLKNYLYAS
ncbi:CBS domain-containing protein [Pararhizobium sp. IMCC21322]|uniref:CBS domain-containing protein n=1 Tax=Pararhizobium sp. IMCC21322 TaxID=3067903 RepID=UPI002740CEAC|nr:CBS domain-containing protein [Pararhizobium sp. IMCC21322]